MIQAGKLFDFVSGVPSFFERLFDRGQVDVGRHLGILIPDQGGDGAADLSQRRRRIVAEEKPVLGKVGQHSLEIREERVLADIQLLFLGVAHFRKRLGDDTIKIRLRRLGGLAGFYHPKHFFVHPGFLPDGLRAGPPASEDGLGLHDRQAVSLDPGSRQEDEKRHVRIPGRNHGGDESAFAVTDEADFAVVAAQDGDPPARQGVGPDQEQPVAGDRRIPVLGAGTADEHGRGKGARAGRRSRSEERAGLVKFGAVSLIVRIISHEIYLEIVYKKCYYSFIN